MVNAAINQVLEECRKHQHVSANMSISNEKHEAIQEAKVLELIQSKGQHSYELTSNGLKAYKLGGVSEYLNDLKFREHRDESIKDLTYDQLKGSIFQVKYWWVILIISGAIGNIELIIGWIKWFIQWLK